MWRQGFTEEKFVHAGFSQDETKRCLFVKLTKSIRNVRALGPATPEKSAKSDLPGQPA
jgi:hypothetical protein